VLDNLYNIVVEIFLILDHFMAKICDTRLQNDSILYKDSDNIKEMLCELKIIIGLNPNKQLFLFFLETINKVFNTHSRLATK
jgi:hypothetical protein